MTDFEGALKFFRVQLPKRYRSEENAKKLMELACSMKVAVRLLSILGFGEFPCSVPVSDILGWEGVKV